MKLIIQSVTSAKGEIFNDEQHQHLIKEEKIGCSQLFDEIPKLAVRKAFIVSKSIPILSTNSTQHEITKH